MKGDLTWLYSGGEERDGVGAAREIRRTGEAVGR